MVKAIAYTALLMSLFLGAARAELSVEQLSQVEQEFFTALNQKPQRIEKALDALTMAYAMDPANGRVNLLLGLNHLWVAAERVEPDPSTLNHVILSEYFLQRAQKLTQDDRIPSWLAPLQITMAKRDQDHDGATRIFNEFVKAYEKNPDFHSFTFAMMNFDNDRDSDEFKRARKVLNATNNCDKHNPSCQNLSRWPHNIETFLVLQADYETKAGDIKNAHKILTDAKRIGEETQWPYLSVIEERLASLPQRAKAFANKDLTDDPKGLFVEQQANTCQMCHRQ